MKTYLRLSFWTLLLLSLAGCAAGIGSGMSLGAILVMINLFVLVGCESDEKSAPATDIVVLPDTVTPDTTTTTDVTETPECDGEWGIDCVDGKITDLCCPKDAICNFGMMPYEDCGDGTCALEPDVCEETCDGEWGQDCIEGQWTDVCCPKRSICNFGKIPNEDCGDGA